MRKPQVGCCGVCGRAVVQPTYDQVKDERRDDFWVSGHHYVCGILDEVRCFQHEPDDGRMPEAV